MLASFVNQLKFLLQSGAIMGVMALVVTKWPDLKLMLVFFPFVPIPALWVKQYLW